MIHITAKKIHGIEVAGMRHPMQTVHYTDDLITDEQLAEMQASEFLTVEVDGVEDAVDPVDPVDPEQVAVPKTARKTAAKK